MANTSSLLQDEEIQLLSETVGETLKKDLINIKEKILLVINPFSEANTLQSYDLWGPLIFCLFLSVVLAITASTNNATLMFTGTFSIITFGGGAATLNLILMSSSSAFFPALCAIGYCLFPLCVSSVLFFLCPILVLKILFVIGGLVFAILAVLRFLKSKLKDDQKYLAIFPCMLLYSILSWMIFLQI
uniref:Protein YIPF n=1 Tax=Coptotermes formosanus TaxID=36987 RepID=R4UMA9_COPFO|nr:Yip1 domain containing protein [Coptotermes formosanus]